MKGRVRFFAERRPAGEAEHEFTGHARVDRNVNRSGKRGTGSFGGYGCAALWHVGITDCSNSIG